MTHIVTMQDIRSVIVCGGRNHGKGEQQAIENTRQFAEQMMQEYATTHHLADWKGFVRNNVKQLTLI